MKASSIGLAALTFSIVFLSFILPAVPKALATSTSTISITGWLTPDSTHLANSILVMMLPLACMGFVTMMLRVFKVKGDIGIYFALGGLFIGSLFSDLSATATATLAVPFGDIFVSGLLVFLWWWGS